MGQKDRVMRWRYLAVLLCHQVVGQLVNNTNTHTEGNSDTDTDTVSGHDKMVVCYWGTWANYRPVEGKFTPESVDGSLCTHLIYSFAGLDTAKSSIKSLDTWMDLETDYGLAGFRKATDLRNTWSHLKVMIAIGGWNEGSRKYSEMAADSKKRAKFVKGTVEFLKKYKFDGLDLDWEYPAKRGGKPDDKNNFILLAKELKEAFLEHNFLLSAAIGAGKSTIDISYDVPKMYKYLDFVNVMCYDYHGRWDKRTGHNAPLRARPDEDENNKVLNDEFSINYLIKLGAIPEKTNLGIPLYGRSFLLKNPGYNHIGDEARSSSFSGPITREEGFLGYNEICKMLVTPDNGWSIVWEACHQAPYMFNQAKWVSYDNEESVRLKADFAWEKSLGGVMVWSIETDDFKGLCGGEKYPMMRALNNALVRKTKNIESEVSVAECNAGDYSTERTIVTLPPLRQTSTTTRASSEAETDEGEEKEKETGPCTNPNGPNPDPSECSQFYLCAGGVPHQMTCRPGTLYSATLMTCDHAGNVECTTSPPSSPSSTEPLQTPTTSRTTRQTTTTVVTLSTVSSSTRVTTTTAVYTTATTTKTTTKYERQTEIIPIRIHDRFPMKEEDLVPILPVDNNDINDDKIDTKFIPDANTAGSDNHLDEVNDDLYNNNVDNEGGQPLDNNYLVSKTNTDPPLDDPEPGMGSEKVAIIILVIILLVVILVFMWCFRAKIKDYTEVYLDRMATDRMRKPSTVSLLKAYQLNKIKFPSYGKEGDSQHYRAATAMSPPQQSLPNLPPKDYSNRDLPPLPLNERAPIAPPRRKKSFSENLYESPSLPQESPSGGSQTLT